MNEENRFENSYIDIGFRKMNKKVSEEVLARRVKILNVKALNAARDGIVFSLSVQDLIWPEYCPVLGIELNYEARSKGSKDDSPSLDRLIPMLGYVPGNVRIISNRANRIKNDGTAEEHRKIAAYIDECSIQARKLVTDCSA